MATIKESAKKLYRFNKHVYEKVHQFKQWKNLKKKEREYWCARALVMRLDDIKWMRRVLKEIEQR